MNTKTVAAVLLVLASFVAAWFALTGGALDQPALPTGAGASNAVAAHGDAVPASADPGTRSAGNETATERSEATPVSTAEGASSGATVRGRIVDRSGAPRPGVEVAANTWPGFEGLDVAPPWPSEANRGNDPTCKTAADGTFVLSVPKNRDGTVDVRGGDLVLEREPPQFRGNKGDQDLGDLVAYRSGAVQGFVRDEAGRPVAGVAVEASVGMLGFGGTSSTKTAADGAFEVGKLRAGRWVLRTASGRFMPTVFETDLQPEERRSDVVLVVRPGNAIAGQVVDDRGIGVAGMKVGSKRKEVRGAVDIERFSADEAATTDAGGFFTLAGLSGEQATIRVHGPGHTPVTVTQVAVGTGNLLVRVERTAAVEGVLVTADGTPIAGSTVSVERGDRPGVAGRFEVGGFDAIPFGRGNVRTGDDGSFRVEDVAPGALLVVAQGKGHLPVRSGGLQARPAETLRGVRLVANAGATARILVRDEQGNPVAGARVRVERVEEEDSLHHGVRIARATASVGANEDEPAPVFFGGDMVLGAAETDANGIAVVIGLPAATARVEAKHADFAPATPVTLQLSGAGSVESTLTMRKPGFAAIQAIGPDGEPATAVPFRITPAVDGAGEPWTGTTDAEGRARSAALAPGDYTAALTRDPSAGRVGDAMVFVGDGSNDAMAGTEQRFTVVAGEVTQVTMRRPQLTRLHGIVTGGAGPMAACVVELARRNAGFPGMPGFGGRSAQTAVDGSFEFTDVEGGAYTLRFGKVEQLVKAETDVEVPPNVAELRHDLTFRAGRLTVRVLAKDSGEPIEGAEVTLERDSGGRDEQAGGRAIMFTAISLDGDAGDTMMMTVGDQRARTDAKGLAVIEDVPVGTYTVRVTDQRYAPASVAAQTVVEERTTDCGDVTLTGAGQIRGTLSTADGTPAPVGFVERRAVGTEKWSDGEVAMGGSFTLRGLAPGKYALRAHAAGPGDHPMSPEVEVEVKAGETTAAELKLPAR